MHWTADMVRKVVEQARASGQKSLSGPLLLFCNEGDTFDLDAAIALHRLDVKLCKHASSGGTQVYFPSGGR